MGGLGAIIATLGGGALYKLNPAYPFWMGSGLVIAATLLLLLFVKEPREFEASKERPNLLRSLKEVVQAQDKSTLRILLAIFCWFMAYNAIEAFFTLFAQNRLGLDVSDSARLLGQLSLVFVLFAFPAGFIGARLGRRLTILSGLAVMIVCLLSIFFLTPAALTLPLAKLPVLGVVPLVGAILMVLGAAWAAINVNSLPMVVDMTDNLHVGTYTGLYYLFSTLAAIVGPNLNGWVIQLMGNNYNLMMIIGPVFLVAAIVSMLGVGQGDVR
jgi:MFS-type transporter involved in bile tolerance (Atg22 family)